ncbi:fidgetin-like protein 1 [Musca domestica]|uniref:Fidgetin-like protein 1 n=1 Tax=Musca domestica TaxID=7370 RepID=A0ABM3VM01_MUSDO|nr:fidgetin-like protein 1 [Musca domestica]
MDRTIDNFKENNMKLTTWRQRTILANEWEEISEDIMEYVCNFTMHIDDTQLKAYSQWIEPKRNVESTILVFPTWDEIDSAYDSESEMMFEHVDNNCDNIEKINVRAEGPRNTMDNFFTGKTNRDPNKFYSAREILVLQNQKSEGNIARKPEENVVQTADFSFSATKKKLGSLVRICNTNKKSFVPPVRTKSSLVPNTFEQNAEENMEDGTDLSNAALKNIDPKMVEVINNEIMHKFKPVDWSEISGLEYAKSIIKEAVVYPLLRPDIFTGLRRPPRGILLFGPPGTGKTLIGKCIASQSKSTFFSISSASLTSKWMGEGEKMVRTLFAVAVARQPSVIFIDEIDSLLSKRSDNENEGTRRLKTEFLVRLDGAATSDDDRVLIVGATNRPQELDEAVRRRFIKRLYVPLPELDARIDILKNLLKTVDNDLTPKEIEEIGNLSIGYSGADMESLCREASMEPVRPVPQDFILTFDKSNLRPVNKNDFLIALKKIRPSVSQDDLDQYVEWNKTYGSSY